jgi:hypothetical protein
LSAIALALLLPLAWVYDGPDRTALEVIAHEPVLWFPIAPGYAVAAVLAVQLLWATMRRRVPGRLSRRIATALLLATAASELLVGVLLLGVGSCVVSNVSSNPLGLLLVAPAVLGADLVRRARAERGWRRWSFLLASYTVLSSPAAAIAISRLESSGGKVHACAYVALVVLSSAGVWPVRAVPVAIGRVR